VTDVPEGESLVTLIDDALNAKGPNELAVALRRVVGHPVLSENERREFHTVLEELSCTLLERWRDLRANRDCVAWSALYHHSGDKTSPPGRPENGTSG
jgi:hypothetical protein